MTKIYNVSKCVVFRILLLAGLSIPAMAAESLENEFIKRTFEYAAQNGMRFETTETGNTSGFYYIPDEHERPYAVLKDKSKQAKKQAFVSKYAEEIGFKNVVISFYVENMPIKGEEVLFDGLVEQYIYFLPQPSFELPKALSKFYQSHQRVGSLNLWSVLETELRLSNHDYLKLKDEYLSKDNVHKFFLFSLLISNEDSEPRNIALRWNGEKIEYVIFDTEHAFSPHMFESHSYSIPFMNMPISDEIKNILFNWTPEKNEKYRDEIDHYSNCGRDWDRNKFNFKNQSFVLNSIKDCFANIKDITPQDILFFAFYRDAYFIYPMEQLHGKLSYKIPGSCSKDEKYIKINRDTFGYFFKETFISTFGGYKAAIEDYNANIGTTNIERVKSFKDFFEFILTRPYFKQELIEEYRQYIKMKFNIELLV
jgi:hypothetical protein